MCLIRKYFILLILGVCIIACKLTVKPNQPQNLDEAIAYFDKTWSHAEKENFKKLTEDEAVCDLHLSTGMWIRNTWIRSSQDTNLLTYFRNIGIHHPDDMSSIILISLHRWLNGKEIDLKGQVENYRSYWKPIIECKEKERKIALQNYKYYRIGDPIGIIMLVDTDGGERNATILQCPNIDWKYNPDKDLKVSGIITDKYFINDSSNVFFKVKITKMNIRNTMIIGESVKTGDIVDFSLKGLTITPAKQKI